MLFLQSLLLFGYTLSSLGNPHVRMGSGETQGLQVYECTSIENDNYKIWLSIEFVFMGIFLLSGLYIAFGVRHVPSAFNESSHIVHALYALTMLAIILIPLNFLVDDPNTLAVLRGIGQCALTLSMVVAVFGVKIYYVLDGRANDPSLIHEKVVSANISVHAVGSHVNAPSSYYASQHHDSMNLQKNVDKSRRTSTTMMMPPLHEHGHGIPPMNTGTTTHTPTRTSSTDAKLLNNNQRASSISMAAHSIVPETSGVPALVWSEWDRSLSELQDIEQARIWLQHIRKQLQGNIGTTHSSTTTSTNQQQEQREHEEMEGQHSPHLSVRAGAGAAPVSPSHFPHASTSSSTVNASGNASPIIPPRHVATTPSSPHAQARHVMMISQSSTIKHQHISTSAPASMYCDPIHEETMNPSSHLHIDTDVHVDVDKNEISQTSPSVNVHFHDNTDAE